MHRTGSLAHGTFVQVGVLTGTEGDATPFTDVTVANVSSTLHKIGFQKHGNEVLYSGHTGRMLTAKVRARGHLLPTAPWLALWGVYGMSHMPHESCFC